MKSFVPLTLVLVLCLALPVVAQSPTAMKVVAMGQLDSPTLRQMSGSMCGPFFTIVPLDSHGGGFLNLAVDRPPDGRAVVRFLVKAIKVTFCESCDVPLFTQSGDESNVRGDLTISPDHWKLSPCLKSAKVSKR